METPQRQGEWAESPYQPNNKKKVKVQLAIQGGGARIIGLIAALEAFHEEEAKGEIEVVRISGTSAGAIAALFYATGTRLDHIRDFITCEENADAFAFLKDPSKGTREYLRLKVVRILLTVSQRLLGRILRKRFGSQKPLSKKALTNLIDAIFNGNSFYDRRDLSDLLKKIIFHSGYPDRNPTYETFFSRERETAEARPTKLSDLHFLAYDLGTQEPVIFKKTDGKLALCDAAAYSASIPFIFHGYSLDQLEKNMHVDGGLFANLPFETLINEPLDYDDSDARDDELPPNYPIIALTFEKVERFQGATAIDNTLVQYGEAILEASTNSSIKRAGNSEQVHVIEVNTQGMTTLGFDSAIEEISKNGSDLLLTIKGHTQSKLIEIKNNERNYIYKLSEIKRRSRLMREELRDSFHSPRGHAADGGGVETIMVEYTNISAISELQDKIFEFIEERYEKRVGHINSKKTGDLRRFDAYQYPGIALSRKVVCAFPFYRTYLRTHIWGVVPYGYHRRFGLVVTEGLKDTILNDVSDYYERGNRWSPAPGSSIQKNNENLLQIAKNLLQHCREGDPGDAASRKLIYAAKGYMAEEIFPLIVRSLYDRDFNDLFTTYLGPVDSVKSDLKSGEKPFSLPKDTLLELEKGRGIWAIDLADKELVFQSIGGNVPFYLIEVAHALPVPVGIGLSLPYAATMSEDHFRKLRALAFEHLRDDVVREKMMDAGIEIMTG